MLVSLQQFKLWIWIYEEGFFFEDSKQLVIIIYESDVCSHVFHKFFHI